MAELQVTDSRPNYDTPSEPEIPQPTKIFHCLNDRVLIRPNEETEKLTAGGLHIAETYQRKPHKGTVLSVGTHQYLGGVVIPITVESGDVVYYSEHTAEEFIFNGERLVIVRFGDLRGFEV